MNRLQAIARLRELADKLEALPDCDGVTFTNNLLIFAYDSSEHDAFATTARREFDAHEYGPLSSGGACYNNPGCTVMVYVRDGYSDTDLLANREVTLIEIGGAA